MQISMLLLFLTLFLHDAMRAHDVPAPMLTGWRLFAVVIGVKLLLLGGYALACRRVARKANQKRLRNLDRLSRLIGMAVVICFAADLYVGWLLVLREGFPGDWVLFDELVALAPALGLMAGCWAAYYPVDRRLREAAMMRRIDTGEPMHPIWSRGQYLLSQVRHQWALMGVPLAALWALGEALSMHLPVEHRDWAMPLHLGGAMMIFVFTPPVMRHIWSTDPLPAGDLRDRLIDMCKLHRVRVRELLQWNTHGGVINAAVMGVVGPLRFILMTDALLERMPTSQVEAVMAHEIAHVRKHHMFWMLAAAIGASGVLEVAARIAWGWVTSDMREALAQWSLAELIPWLIGGLLIGVWLLIFGWVSRRFERQADTFAVEHLSIARGSGALTVDAPSARTMVDALQQVAVLNHISTNRRSWRHGSIAWRQQYLLSLVGLPLDQLPIHRQVMWIKLAAAMAVAATAMTYIMPG